MAAKQRLTPHQKYWYERLCKRARFAGFKDADGYLRADEMSGGQVWQTLAGKGYIDITWKYGPRGGLQTWARPKGG